MCKLQARQLLSPNYHIIFVRSSSVRQGLRKVTRYRVTPTRKSQRGNVTAIIFFVPFFSMVNFVSLVESRFSRPAHRRCVRITLHAILFFCCFQKFKRESFTFSRVVENIQLFPVILYFVIFYAQQNEHEAND